DWLINAFATLFVIIDPLGLAPIFLVVTAGMSAGERANVALRASLTAFGILAFFAVFGAGLLNALGITLPAFRIAGGLLLFYTAAEMIFEKRQVRKRETAQKSVTVEDLKNISIYPLAIPLMAGPGAISATVLLASERDGYAELALLVGLIAGIVLIAYLVFRLAERLDRLLGDTGRALLSRLLGVLLAALSVQFVVDGIRSIIAAS
ncbi:MAG: MarC family protein, partial [Pseudomonadota bacterium]